MAKHSSSSRRGRESDSLEALKPLVVLGLFGMILYGAYSVVQKGAAPLTELADAGAGGEAPPFQAPDVALSAPQAASPAPVTASVVPDPPPLAAPEAAPPPAPPAVVPPPSAPDAIPTGSATFLTAESAPPPVAEPVAATPPPAPPEALPADRLAALPASQIPPGLMAPPPADTATLPPPPPVGVSPSAAVASGASAAFTAAWADAQDKLAGGRWAEALGTLSVWYDDPSLGLEETQRLEDLLGQLAGTVIYSQQDLLLPPHVVAAGETLPSIAAPLGVSWQLLAKINGVSDPQALLPGEQLKLVRGPFDAVVSVSRRRLSLQLGGNYAGSFPVTIGRQVLDRVGGSLPVVTVQRTSGDAEARLGDPLPRAAVILGDGMAIEAADPSGFTGDAAPQASLVVAPHDLAELLDILGPGSRVLVRQ